MSRLLLSSLQLRLILGVAVLFLGSLWGFAFLLAKQQAALIERMLTDQQRATIGYVAEDIDQRLRRRLDSLTQATTILPLEQLGDRVRLEDILRQRPVLHKLFDAGIIVVKPDGSGAYADYLPVPGRRGYGVENLGAVADVIRSGRAVVGKPFVAPQSPRPLLGFAVPVRDGAGRLAAILAGVSSMHAPDLLGIISQHRYGRTGDFVIVAPEYDITVTGSDPIYAMRPLPPPGVNAMLDRIRKGEEGYGVTVDSRGIELLVSARRLSATGWFAVARLPTSEAFAPIVALRRLVFGGAVFLSLLVAALAALWVRRALAPLRDATQALDAISAGTAPLRPLPVERPDEVGRLVESFNRLQQRLGQRETELIAAREEMKDITDSVPVAVYRYRLEDDGRPNLMYISEHVESLWGITAAEAMRDQASLFGRIHPDDLPGFMAADRAASAAQSSFAHELRAVMPDGAIHWLRLQSEPKRLADGRIVYNGYAQDISEEKATAAEVRRLQDRFAVAFRASPIAASIARAADGCFIEVNARWQGEFGWRREELVGRSSVDIGIWPDEAVRQSWIEVLRRDGHVFDHVTRWRRKDGALRDVSISAEMIEMDGEPCVLAFVTDVTDRLLAERALAESEARNRRMIETANEGIWSMDADHRTVFVNRRMAELLGETPAAMLGKRVEDFMFPEDLAEHAKKMAECHAGAGGSYERRFRRKDGGELWTQVAATATMNPDGSFGGSFAMFTDISHLKEYQRELERIAHYDALTGIPNRVMLADRMRLAIAQTRRSGRTMAVCYLDLDGFKPVNDAYGHEAGDCLLIEISERLRAGLRGGDTVARLGGDEFVVLLLDLEQGAEIEAALVRILESVARPVRVDGHEATLSASIGVTLFPADDVDPDTLLRHADHAMYAAKQGGKNRWQMFDVISR